MENMIEFVSKRPVTVSWPLSSDVVCWLIRVSSHNQMGLGTILPYPSVHARVAKIFPFSWSFLLRSLLLRTHAYWNITNIFLLINALFVSVELETNAAEGSAQYNSILTEIAETATASSMSPDTNHNELTTENQNSHKPPEQVSGQQQDLQVYLQRSDTAVIYPESVDTTRSNENGEFVFLLKHFIRVILAASRAVPRGIVLYIAMW